MASEPDNLSVWQRKEGDLFVRTRSGGDVVVYRISPLVEHLRKYAIRYSLALITAATPLLVAFFRQESPKTPAADSCAMARTHFETARDNIRDLILKKIHLAEHLTKYANCGLATEAVSLLYETERALHPLPVPPVAPAPPPAVPPKPPTQATELPNQAAVVELVEGERLRLQVNVAYPVRPRANFTTYARVIQGSASLTIGGALQFQCRSNVSFQMPGEANARYVLSSCTKTAVIDIEDVVEDG